MPGAEGETDPQRPPRGVRPAESPTPAPAVSVGEKNFRGRRLGRYTLLDHLATGGMAEIFLARHEAHGGFVKDLVLKTLQGRFADDPRVVAMFLDEARLAAQLNHPNIVDVYDVGEEAGVHYIAMEYIPGKTLTDLIRRSIEVSLPMSRAHAAFIVAQAAEGLAFMQTGTDPSGKLLEIIHRDISPSNLIVSLAGQTKIIDFGIAKQGRNVKEESGTRPGKVSYMSPEQVMGRPLDGRSDIFSLGTILYEITLRKRLWRGQPESVMRRIVEETPPPPTYVDRDYPRDLELVVQKALEKKPEQRYQTAADLFHDLDVYLDGLGVRAGSRHIARYVHDVFAPQTQVSARGQRRALAFLSDAEPVGPDDEDELDFDRRPFRPSGVALAEVLRASGPLVPISPPAATERSPLFMLEEQSSPAPAAAWAAGGIAARTPAPIGLPPAPAPQPSPAPEAPRRSGLIWALVVASAVAAWVVWLLAKT